MNPGEYIGKDGNTYRWLGDSRGYVMLQVWSKRLDDWVTSPMNPEDLPDAEAALDSYTSFLASFPKAVPLGCFDGRFELVLWSDDLRDAEGFAGRSMVMPPIRVRVMSRCSLPPPIRRVTRTA